MAFNNETSKTRKRVQRTSVRSAQKAMSNVPTTLFLEVRKVEVKVLGGRSFEGAFLEGGLHFCGEKGKPEACASGFPALICVSEDDCLLANQGLEILFGGSNGRKLELLDKQIENSG